jgi:hypothetical protein
MCLAIVAKTPVAAIAPLAAAYEGSYRVAAMAPVTTAALPISG